MNFMPDTPRDMPSPLLWRLLEDDRINKATDPEIYLEVRNLISESLSKLKRSKRVEVLDVCVGMDKDGKAKEFGITCEYKGMPVCLKGMIGAAA
jgi:hypothetical protein